MCPYVVEAQRLVQGFSLEHRAVEGADGGGSRGQLCHLFEHMLHLYAVLSADVEVVAACLAGPVIGVGIVDTELSETVGGEEHFVLRVVANHHLRPVYHRCHEEGKGMLSQFEGVLLLHCHHLSGEVIVRVEERKHLRRLG